MNFRMCVHFFLISGQPYYPPIKDGITRVNVSHLFQHLDDIERSRDVHNQNQGENYNHKSAADTVDQNQKNAGPSEDKQEPQKFIYNNRNSNFAQININQNQDRNHNQDSDSYNQNVHQGDRNRFQVDQQANFNQKWEHINQEQQQNFNNNQDNFNRHTDTPYQSWKKHVTQSPNAAHSDVYRDRDSYSANRRQQYPARRARTTPRPRYPTAAPRPPPEARHEVEWFEEYHQFSLRASVDLRLRIRHAPIPMAGSPWPMPQKYRPSRSQVCAYCVTQYNFQSLSLQ